MRILYDYQMFSMQKFGGITRYFCDLFMHLPKDVMYELPIVYSENHYLQDSGKFNLRQISAISSFRVKRRLYYFANQIVSKKAIQSDQYDLFHPTYYSPYFCKYLNKPFVLTVHDMTHEKFREYFGKYDHTIEHKRFLIERASHIIAVSQNTKNDIVELLNIPEDKISVVYHGYEQNVSPAEPLFSNYILFVGDRKGYKNFDTFIKAITPMLRERKDLSVVCTGHPFSRGELELFARFSIESQMHHLNATDTQLASLYKYALVFVYPSLYEGFGIPILEAFQNGCPVCLSRASCFPEIGADAVAYFDPLDVDSIAETVMSVIDSKTLSDVLRQKGYVRKEQFSIEKMVKGTCEVYRRMVM